MQFRIKSDPDFCVFLFASKKFNELTKKIYTISIYRVLIFFLLNKFSFL